MHDNAEYVKAERADERTEQFERGYQAALREATVAVKAIEWKWLDVEPGACLPMVNRVNVLDMLEAMRRD